MVVFQPDIGKGFGHLVVEQPFLNITVAGDGMDFYAELSSESSITP